MGRRRRAGSAVPGASSRDVFRRRAVGGRPGAAAVAAQSSDSPEYEPRPNPEEGHKTLSEMARITGGSERTSWDDVFKSTGLRNRQIRDLILPLTLVLLVLQVGEVAGRRLLAFDAASAWMRARRLPRWGRSRTSGRVPAPGASGVEAIFPSAATTDGASSAPSLPTWEGSGPPATAEAPRGLTESPLARAKARARSRLGD